MKFIRLKEQEVFARIVERIEKKRITISVLDPSHELEETLSPMLEREKVRLRNSGATLSEEFTRGMARNELRMFVRWTDLWSKLSSGQEWMDEPSESPNQTKL